MRATNEDYKPLYEQAETIEKNFETIKEMNNVRCNFVGKYKVITLTSKTSKNVV